jgi:DNA-directed RNA polymerase specialized sigma24 family protein
MKAFVAADLAAYGVFSAAAWALAPWTSPAEAAAQAFLLMYATHLAICYLRARSRHGARPSARATAAWAAGCAVTLAVSVAFWEIQ